MGGYRLKQELLERAVNVAVVGVGGSGSHIAANLAVLHQSMVALGHPQGLAVTLCDGDGVSHANVGRARFFEQDVGLNKAAVLAHRINMTYGLEFKAVEERVDEGSSLLREADVIIGCVDTRQSRRAIHEALTSEKGCTWKERIWLDLGNGAIDGQVIMGVMRGTKVLIPGVTHLYPEMLDERLDPQDDGPSCSMAEALKRQSAFVNCAAAMHAVGMLSNLFRTGLLEYNAVFFNLGTGRSAPLKCSLQDWMRLGYKPGRGDVGREECAEEETLA